MAFEPIRTERLILRAPLISDAEAAFERRRLPEVARYQDWEMPYTRERAEASMARSAAMDGFAVGRRHPDRVVIASRQRPVGSRARGVRAALRGAHA